MRLIDRSNPQKLYLQLVEVIKQSISDGEYPVGMKLPTEDQICAQQGVSKAVVRAAMDNLTRRGYVRKIPGKGTFAQKPQDASGVWLSTEISENLLDFGLPWETEVVQKMLSVAPSDLRELFKTETENKVFKIIRLRFVDDMPIVHETAFISHELCPGMSLEDLRNCSLIDLITSKYGVPIQRCADSMGVTTLDEKEAELLQQKPGTPVMLADRILYTTNNRVAGFIRIINTSENHRVSYEAVRIAKG